MNDHPNLAAPERRACFGLVRRKQTWVLTWRARLLLGLGLVVAAVCGVRGAHDFLAVHAPVQTKALVIEGWVPRYAVTGFVARVQGDYTDIFTTGGPTLTDPHSRDESDTYASVIKTRLARSSRYGNWSASHDSSCGKVNTTWK